MTNVSRAGLILSLTGAALMARGLALEGNIIWFISNPMWMYYAHQIGAKDMLYLSMAYWILCIYGVWYLM